MPLARSPPPSRKKLQKIEVPGRALGFSLPQAQACPDTRPLKDREGMSGLADLKALGVDQWKLKEIGFSC